MLDENKITFADMRDMGVRGLLIYCSDYRCTLTSSLPRVVQSHSANALDGGIL